MLFFSLRRRRPPRSTRVPYTTLFRSRVRTVRLDREAAAAGGLDHTEHLLGLLPRTGVRDGDGSALRGEPLRDRGDRKSTRLNSSHANISHAVFCLKEMTRT